MVVHTIRIIHANELYRMYFSQATWALARMYERKLTRYDNLFNAFPRREEATSKQWQRLIQARHHVMAIIKVLRDKNAWDEFKEQPLDGDGVDKVSEVV